MDARTNLDFKNKSALIVLGVYEERLILTGIPFTSDEIRNYLIPYLKSHPEIKSLRLNECEIDSAGAKQLAEINTITELDISDNDIGDEGAKAFAANQSITRLNVGSNNITDEGAKAFSANKTIIELFMYGNNITDEGAKAFFSNKTIKKLDFSANYVSDECLKVLAASDASAEGLSFKIISVSFCDRITRTGLNALEETDPHKRAQHALNAGINPADVPVPSLKRLCLFKIKNSPQLNKDHLTVDLKEELKKPKV